MYDYDTGQLTDMDALSLTLNALKNANSYKQQILSIVKTQSQKEQDALFKVIDARKEALKKKKEYYDYDKQLKSKTLLKLFKCLLRSLETS